MRESLVCKAIDFTYVLDTFLLAYGILINGNSKIIFFNIRMVIQRIINKNIAFPGDLCHQNLPRNPFNLKIWMKPFMGNLPQQDKGKAKQLDFQTFILG